MDEVGEVLGLLAAHDALLACDSRSDLELLLLRPLPGSLWIEIERWSAEQDCSVGEAVYAWHESATEKEREGDVVALAEEVRRRRQRTAYLELARLKACPGTSYLFAGALAR
jgi:hypothetical protein